MSRIRKDTKGKVLHKGEDYKKDKKLYRYSYTDSLGKRRCIYAKNLEELRNKEKQLQRDQLDGLDIYVQGNADVNYAFHRYIATKTELRSSTKTNYLYIYDRYVKDGFGKKKLSEVRYSDVLLFYNALLGKGLSIGTMDSVNAVLRPTFQLAVRDNVIRNNPADGAMTEVKKKWDGNIGIRHALTIEEERAFLESLELKKNLSWKPLFIVMFGTGCRISEIIGLRWDDVDFEKGIITIDHDVTYYPRSDKNYRCEYELALPKTEAGIRKIPMLKKVKDALELEKQNQRDYGYHCLVELGGMKNFIFCNRFGGLQKPASVNKVIKRIVSDHNSKEIVDAKREGREPVIIPNFSCHITRHTFCTRLCENGTNAKVIQSVMGHKDIQTTLGIYAEVSENKKKDIFEQLNNQDVI